MMDSERELRAKLQNLQSNSKIDLEAVISKSGKQRRLRTIGISGASILCLGAVGIFALPAVVSNAPFGAAEMNQAGAALSQPDGPNLDREPPGADDGIQTTVSPEIVCGESFLPLAGPNPLFDLKFENFKTTPTSLANQSFQFELRNISAETIKVTLSATDLPVLDANGIVVGIYRSPAASTDSTIQPSAMAPASTLTLSTNYRFESCSALGATVGSPSTVVPAIRIEAQETNEALDTTIYGQALSFEH